MAFDRASLKWVGRPGRRVWLTGLLIFCVALGAGFAILRAKGADEPLSDGLQYLALAKSMVSGGGYRMNLWPGTSADRMPGWPLLLVGPLQAFAGWDPLTVARHTAAFFHALGAAVLFGAAFLLCGRLWAAAVAGLLAATLPGMLYMVLLNLSEVPMAFFIASGMLLITSGGRRAYVGALLLGAAALTRSNVIILPAAVFAVCLMFPGGRRALRERAQLARFAALTAVFAILPGGWVVRNYVVTGHAVVSNHEGETLYGANNDIVATDLQQWGYWIMPDGIPGELPKAELAKRMSEHELDRYYHAKGMQYMRENWFTMPRLLLGRLVRAFVPVPWAPSWGSYVAFFWRGLLDVAVLASAGLWYRRTNGIYLAMLGGLFLVNLMTTLMYYGSYRFTCCTVEVYCLPLLACALGALREKAGPRRAAAAA